jgi:L-ascorbate metabolism protein UlaG (beta-lactamase superfamily)
LLKRIHFDRVLLAGEVSDQFKSPARWNHYKEGGSYSLLVEHEGKKILVQSSAGYLSGALNGHEADIVFLGIGRLGKQSPDYRAAYWREVVEAVGARRVIPIHWDDFSKSLQWGDSSKSFDRPLEPPSPLVDNVQRSLAFLLAQGKKTRVDVKILPACVKIDPFAGLKRYQGKPKRRST